MGLFDDIGDGLSSIGDAIVETVETVVDTIAEVTETVGNTLEDVFSSVGQATTIIIDFVSFFVTILIEASTKILTVVPVVGKYLALPLKWLSSIIASSLNLASSVISLTFNNLGALIGGTVKIIGGILGLRKSLIIEGLINDIFHAFIGNNVVVVGNILGTIQSVIPILQGFRQKLTKDEIKMLDNIFRGSILLFNIEIVEGFAGIFSVNDRPFTLGNTIYIKNQRQRREVLLHECVHVWQYRKLGGKYSTQAIYAQWSEDNAYDWENEINSGKNHFLEFNLESQGKFIEDIYTLGYLEASNNNPQENGNGCFFEADIRQRNAKFISIQSGLDRTGFANEAITILRG